MVYRVLKHHGFLYRTRIYEMSQLRCDNNTKTGDDDDQLTPHGVRGLDDIEEKFDETVDNETKYTENNIDYDYHQSSNSLFEDFVMPTNSRITALNLHGGNTITYSQYPDFYEFRVIKKINGTWTFQDFGPFIDKTVDEAYVCTGIQYLDMDANKNLEPGVEASFGEYAIVVSIRGKDAKNLNLTAKGHMKMSRK